MIFVVFDFSSVLVIRLATPDGPRRATDPWLQRELLDERQPSLSVPAAAVATGLTGFTRVALVGGIHDTLR